MEQLINLQDVYRIYNEHEENEVRALDGVSLTIDRGEFVAIVGASGSGKSTLMNILGCLDVPTYGDYFLHGHDVMTMTDGELSKIRNKEVGFIFQGYNLIPALTAQENVELPLVYQGIHGEKRAEMAWRALDRVGLSEQADRTPSKMSGGQQQRIAVARAIATSAPMILADEPTGALDSKTGKQVLEILHQLNGEGTTIILITHDLNIAQTAKRQIIISDGKIIQDTKEGYHESDAGL